MPSLGSGTRVLLAGGPYALRERPPESSAELATTTEARDPSGSALSLTALVLDRAGAFVLEEPGGETLTLRAGGHATTPLDCGRSECHAAAASAADASPMTHALAHDLASAMDDPSCALACHAVGEPGDVAARYRRLAREIRHPQPAVLGVFEDPQDVIPGERWQVRLGKRGLDLFEQHRLGSDEAGPGALAGIGGGDHGRKFTGF